MRYYYFARVWDDEDTLVELLETTFETPDEYEARLRKRWAPRTVAVDDLTLREFLWLGRRLDDAVDSQCKLDGVCNGK